MLADARNQPEIGRISVTDVKAQHLVIITNAVVVSRLHFPLAQDTHVLVDIGRADASVQSKVSRTNL